MRLLDNLGNDVLNWKFRNINIYSQVEPNILMITELNGKDCHQANTVQAE